MWFRMVSSRFDGFEWFRVVSSGFEWFQVVSSGFDGLGEVSNSDM